MAVPESNLREFVSANERHPESVRTVPELRAAGGDSVSAEIIGNCRAFSRQAGFKLQFVVSTSPQITQNE